MNRLKMVFCAAISSSVLIGGAGALAATSAPAGGTISLYVTPSSGTNSKILLTGAIGDFGTAVSIDKNGKADPNGAYEKVTLKHGSFEINATNFETSIQHARPKLNNHTCTVDLAAHGTASLRHGTGRYKAISGKLKLRYVLGGLAPRFTTGPKQGTCNLTQGGPALDLYQAILGSGNVAFK